MRQLQQNEPPQLPPKNHVSPADRKKNTTNTNNKPAVDEILQEIRHLGVNDHKVDNKTQGTTIEEKDPMQKPLPQDFTVKYLGKRVATGLWGIKHTRSPVDDMVSTAKNLPRGKTLPFLKLHVSEKGVNIAEMPQNLNKNFTPGLFPIEVISYGVQDLVYTRVFAMIVVHEESKSDPSVHPFHCHAFVCESRSSARKLTFALAEAFQQFSKRVKTNKNLKPKKFAIDLRSADEIEADLREMDSEA